jgi:glycosyltransferase involved in cell wall biosynthesis
MKIGIVLDYDISNGGGFQQALTTIKLITRYNKVFEFIIFTTPNNKEFFKQYKIKSVIIRLSIFDKFLIRIRKKIYKLKKLFPNKLERYFNKRNIDLLYFISPSSLVLFIENYNYILTVWDSCHRDHMEFPEVYSDGEFDKRELYYLTVLPKSTAILVDSEISKNNLAIRYAIDPERIYVVPFCLTENINSEEEVNIKNIYNINNKFIFYPAQLWPHKNHKYIIDALYFLKKKYSISIDAVFTGNDKGNKRYLLTKCKEYCIDNQIHFIGFIPLEHLRSFYKTAEALVMPTYFGPTNLPPLEAFSLGCPVCYSDLIDLRDHVEGAAFLLDLENPQSLVNSLLKILEKDPIVYEYIEKGRKKAEEWKDIDYWQVLKLIFDKYRVKLNCWK